MYQDEDRSKTRFSSDRLDSLTIDKERKAVSVFQRYSGSPNHSPQGIICNVYRQFGNS
jgi:hypothetical protein